jgi:hypothetical protein
MRLQASPTSAADQYLAAYCYATDAVGDVVYVMGNKVGEKYQVTKVDIDDIATMPSVGVIIEKPDASECVVQVAGVIRGVYTGLTPHKMMFVGTDSRLTETPTPRKPTSGERAHQNMGYVLSNSELLLRVQQPIILTT